MATDGKVTFWDATSGSPSYNAQELRQLDSPLLMPGPASAPFSGRSGRQVNNSGLAVTVDSTGAGAVSVSAGAGVIYDGAFAVGGAWRFVLPTAKTGIALAARPGSGTSRIDLVVARIYDTGGSTPVKELKIEVVTGAPNATPSAPALPALSIELARLTVSSTSGAAISKTDTTAVSVAAGGILPVATTNERDGLVTAGIAYRGLVVHNAQTGQVEAYNGTAWVQLQQPDYVAPVTVGATGAPAYASGWAATAEGSTFSRRSGWVLVTVVAAKGTIAAGDTIFVLPAGFRPDRVVRFIAQFGGNLRFCRVDQTGAVTVDTATTGGVAGAVSFPVV